MAEEDRAGGPRAEVDSEGESFSHIGQGLTSCVQAPGLQQLTNLRSLCLHGNNIARIDGLQHLANLTDLNLSSNSLSHLDGLAALTCLVTLNVASNRLQSLHGLAGLSSLTHLNASYNYIGNIAGVSALQGPLCRLRVLNLKHNQITSLQTFSVLVGCIHLRELHIAGNPVAQLPNCMQAVVSVIPQLTHLDQLHATEVLSMPFDMQAAQQLASMQLHAYEPTSYAGPSPAGAGLPPASGGAALAWPALQTGQAASGPGLQRHQQPQRDQQPAAPVQQPAAPAPAYPGGGMGQPSASLQPRPAANWQAPTRRQRAGGEAEGFEGQDGPSSLAQPLPPQQPQARGQYGAAASDVLPDVDQLEQHSQSHHHPVAAQLSPPQQQPQRVKVFLTDAAAQTSEYTPLARRLQTEALGLRQQLTKLTDELERRNALEEDMRQQMQDAITAAENTAHKKVEEGFREASFAVSKALQELESARRAAQDAQDRVAGHARAEEEQKQRCMALEKDVRRRHEELQRLHAQLQAQQQQGAAALDDERRRAASAVDEERRRAAEQAQAAAQHAQQAQALSAELSVTKAACTAAEQKVAALEAALQQSSTVTVSMTAKIAQTMADANAQIDILKSRLSATEQQVAQYQQREVDARAEINMLTGAMAAARQQHQRELEQAQKQHEDGLRLALEKERLGGEERGKAAAQLTAQQDRCALQEQITYFKTQLQFALKECDKELATAQEALHAAHAESDDLRAALQAAAVKQREAEALVTDFTSVVQQQKEAIRGLQREREALQARLRACAPEAYDALATENLSLKRGVAERAMYKEQAEEAQRRWQEAERRVTELQVQSSRQQDELNAKARSLEAALAAARDEASRCETQAERLRQEVAQQTDAVKVKVAMIDSANETIASLKAEVADLQGEVEDARRQAEEAEAMLAREQQDEDRDKAQLRSDLEAAEAAMQQMRGSLTEAQAKLRDCEGRLRSAQDAVADKDRMIKYVEEEVDRVKGLFEKREQRLREERDAARHDAGAALSARESAESRCADALARIEGLGRELETVRSQLAQAHRQLDAASTELQSQRTAAQAAHEAAELHGAEAVRLAARVTEVEAEMRQLLMAVEHQKATSANKMKQLASLLQDL